MIIMKKLLLTGIISLILFQAAFVFAAPKITSDDPDWEFEKVMEGEVVKHDYVIKNTGDEKLQITRVRGSCGCTAATAGKKVLEPGEQTEIKVNFNTTGRTGKQTKYIYIYTNDPETKVFKLTITGQVERKPAPQMIIRPYSWSLNITSPTDIQRTTISISNTGEKPLQIESIETSTGNLKANLLGPDTVAPSGRVNLELTYTPELTGNPNIREKIIIKSNDPKRGIYNYNVYGRLQITNLGVSVFILGAQKKENDYQVDIHVNNSRGDGVDVKVPDAANPNEFSITGNSVRKFSVMVPEDVLETKPAEGTEGPADVSNLKKLEVDLFLDVMSRGTTPSPLQRRRELIESQIKSPPPPPSQAAPQKKEKEGEEE